MKTLRKIAGWLACVLSNLAWKLAIFSDEVTDDHMLELYYPSRPDPLDLEEMLRWEPEPKNWRH